MNDLQEFFKSVAIEKKKVAEEQSRLQEREQRLQPQVKVELNDLSDFFGVLGNAKRNLRPQTIKQISETPKVEEIKLNLELESFFNRLSSFENALEKIDQPQQEPIIQEQIIEPVIQPETHKAENRIIREVIEETPEEKVEEVKPVDLNELRFPTKEMMSESEDTNVSQLAEAMNRFNKKDEIITEEISDLEQLKREFKNFKDTVIKQMSTIGGGGEVNLLKLDDIDTGAIGDGKVLSYNSGTGKLQFVTGGAGALADLTDVDDTDLANDSIMQYNSTSGKFEFTNELDGGTV
tara:strand:+ start:377 stop:1255 length:879 start_codon:yes stop_codon:yes gene_type:complete